MRRVRVAVAGVILAGLLAFLVSFVYVCWVGRQDERPFTHAIVVLGAAHYNGRPSQVLRARLDHAAALYAEGRAPFIVVTGGMAEGDRVSEATVSQRYLTGLRVPDAAIVVRPDGRNSRESVASAAEWLHDRSLRTVLLVSDPFHMARLKAEARRQRLEPFTSPTRTSPISSRWLDVLRRLVAEALKVPAVLLSPAPAGNTART